MVFFLMRKSFIPQPALFAPQDFYAHPAPDGWEGVVDGSAITTLLPQGAEGRATGRPGYPALTLFRALLSGQVYRLSDVPLEACLARDLLFRKFCHLEMDRGVPASTTLGRFCARLGGRAQALFDEVPHGPAARNLILTEGGIAVVDVESPPAIGSRAGLRCDRSRAMRAAPSRSRGGRPCKGQFQRPKAGGPGLERLCLRG